ncbi:DNA-methyltransferase [Kaistia sp. UC242_56]|uniref:DNA-methyltransferase n=1 Tax=Kaistia sp. UC242_56 TaxID=3374625 RepID=UPI0037B6CAEF
MAAHQIIHADCMVALAGLADESVDCIVTDPPYGETSLEWDRWPAGWPAAVRRVLKRTGSMWCFGSQRLFIEKSAEFTGWKLAQDVIWEKHNGSGFASDRFRRVHEIATQWYRDDALWSEVYKAPQFTYDAEPKVVHRAATPQNTFGARGRVSYATEAGGPRLMRSVMRVRSEHGRALHPTQKPIGIVEPLLRYACPPGGTVLDPFAGSGTTGAVAAQRGMQSILIEGSAEFVGVIKDRLASDLFFASTPIPSTAA